MSRAATAPSPPLLRGWFVVGLLWLVACCNWAARGMIATMHDTVLTAIPMREAQFGLLTSLFAWIYGGLSPVAGYLSDRFSRSRVIVGTLFAWSAVTWLTGYARNVDELLALRGLMAICEASFLPAALALITDYHRDVTRSLAVGVLMSGTGVGGALAGVGGWLSERHSWGYPFAVVGLSGIAFAVVLAFVLKDAPRESVREKAAQAASAGPAEALAPVRFGHALRTLLRRGSFWLVLVYYALSGVVGWMVLAWMPTFIQQRFHLGQGTAGFSATGYFNGAYMVGVFAGGALADRWSRTHPRGRILVPAIALCFAAPGILLTAQVPLLAFALGGLVTFGIAGGFSDANMMPILCLISDARYRGSAYGLLNFVGAVSGGLAIFAGGWLQDRHYGLGLILTGTAIAMVLCPILLFLVRPASDEAASTD